APLHYALRNNQVLIVKGLLEKGANPNMKDRRGRTPLQIARSVDSELERLVKAKGGN
ncbi:MAG: ankyrin repeat domain-containing protein, partial [Chitinispirillaceae bacterium]